jgi:glutathione S-transferase
MAPVLGYWNIRGLAQPIRMVLAQAGLEFEEKLYNCGPPPTFDKSGWFNEKPTLGLDFANLPYYIDGDVKLVQSLAIIRYIAQKSNLVGQTDAEKTRIDLIGAQISDYKNTFTGMCYDPRFDELKSDYLKGLPAKLKALSDYLGANPWWAGQNLSYVDFIAYEFLDATRIFAPKSLEDFANLRDFVSRVEALPNIAAYQKSDRYIKWPFNNDRATYGGRYGKP